MQSNDLKFSISVGKNEFHEGDSVLCNMVLTNHGGTSIFVNKRFLVNFPDMRRDIYFEITDSQGRTAPFALVVNVGLVEARHFEELQPQESVSKEIDLARDFKLDPGTYTVKAVYENNIAPPELDASRVWIGKIDSNNLNITVR